MEAAQGDYGRRRAGGWVFDMSFSYLFGFPDFLSDCFHSCAWLSGFRRIHALFGSHTPSFLVATRSVFGNPSDVWSSCDTSTFLPQTRGNNPVHIIMSLDTSNVCPATSLND